MTIFFQNIVNLTKMKKIMQFYSHVLIRTTSVMINCSAYINLRYLKN